MLLQLCEIRKGHKISCTTGAEADLSPRYLSDMLRALTGQNTQQFIHEKLVEKAKIRLLGWQ